MYLEFRFFMLELIQIC
uniref:Uncharacterized protein n=1 Tax=Rhizophora mucronata TaxID=61149 RepID=A0A2P2IKE0_RHIMU